jgi:hypothetical protein
MVELAELVALTAEVAEFAFPFSGPTKLVAESAPVEGIKLSRELATR